MLITVRAERVKVQTKVDKLELAWMNFATKFSKLLATNRTCFDSCQCAFAKGNSIKKQEWQ